FTPIAKTSPNGTTYICRAWFRDVLGQTPGGLVRYSFSHNGVAPGGAALGFRTTDGLAAFLCFNRSGLAMGLTQIKQLVQLADAVSTWPSELSFDDYP